jgi:hypothetical protein
MILKAVQKKKFLTKTQKNNLLKNTLSIRVRNLAPPNEPLIIVKNFFYFNPEVANT